MVSGMISTRDVCAFYNEHAWLSPVSAGGLCSLLRHVGEETAPLPALLSFPALWRCPLGLLNKHTVPGSGLTLVCLGSKSGIWGESCLQTWAVASEKLYVLGQGVNTN